ncbi:MAG TPA: hypothetical protein VNU46_07805, partial [Gemmatimonadaceae bacterium]|nr:hypothetical protein [Gemmatimonadaceae bacterium]
MRTWIVAEGGWPRATAPQRPRPPTLSHDPSAHCLPTLALPWSAAEVAFGPVVAIVPRFVVAAIWEAAARAVFKASFRPVFAEVALGPVSKIAFWAVAEVPLGAIPKVAFWGATEVTFGPVAKVTFR